MAGKGIPVLTAMNVVGTIMRVLVLKRTKKSAIWNANASKWVSPEMTFLLEDGRSSTWPTMS